MQVSDDGADDVVALTEAAARAAEEGAWNVVEACYHKRRTVLDVSPLSPEAAARMLKIDEEVAERLRVSQAGILALLRDTAQVRHRLRDLHQWHVGHGGPPSLITKHL